MDVVLRPAPWVWEQVGIGGQRGCGNFLCKVWDVMGEAREGQRSTEFIWTALSSVSIFTKKTVSVKARGKKKIKTVSFLIMATVAQHRALNTLPKI